MGQFVDLNFARIMVNGDNAQASHASSPRFTFAVLVDSRHPLHTAVSQCVYFVA